MRRSRVSRCKPHPTLETSGPAEGAFV
jgi:hypothetical protein